jgi:hypothetical protein
MKSSLRFAAINGSGAERRVKRSISSRQKRTSLSANEMGPTVKGNTLTCSVEIPGRTRALFHSHSWLRYDVTKHKDPQRGGGKKTVQGKYPTLCHRRQLRMRVISSPRRSGVETRHRLTRYYKRDPRWSRHVIYSFVFRRVYLHKRSGFFQQLQPETQLIATVNPILLEFSSRNID